MLGVSAPATSPSELAAIAATAVFVCPLVVSNAIRAPPRPLKDKAPLLAVEIKVQVLPPLAERRMPRPK